MFILYIIGLVLAEVSVIQFNNLGYTGYYSEVSELNDIDSHSCSCQVSSDVVKFSGPNAPLNEEVSVHFRGPIILNRFASYVSDNFTFNENSGNWTRISYYDDQRQVAENVTFLTKAGEDSICLGRALTYADSDGVSKANKSTILGEDTLIGSNEEYAIFSNISCGESGLNNDCGVYRPDIPAYHGFYGTTKMFLFEFQMPNDTSGANISNYNMPAIWLLNAKIPRTSQYSQNVNCSCWRSGCGEFDIFEVMNTTEYLNLYSTLHDYQGTDDIENGLAEGYMERDLNNIMVGGVAFDSEGTVNVWLSKDTIFDSSISANVVNSWLGKIDDDAVTTSLSSISLAAPTGSSTGSSSKKSDGVIYQAGLWTQLLFGLICII
ncbi:unnamed protein product [Candida verbasci]|uniref:glucan endo-1,3-beta-D-glucosidase n=1 Tax=Candida verbasci TaxID=1227364 RepID=A0A9W4TRH7_9ASCO|nr:unnamed protein product [Candida verbasci]